MRLDLNRAVAAGLALFLVSLAVLGLWIYLYGRPKLSQHQVSLVFVTDPTPVERARTVAILGARLGELADPKWRAQIVPQMDGTLLLTYFKSGGAVDLAEAIIPRGVCEFRLLDVDKERLEHAQQHGPPEGYEIISYLEAYYDYDRGTNEIIRKERPTLVQKEPALRPKSFKNVSFWTKGIAKYTHVKFELEPDDAVRLAEICEKHPGRPVAVIVDGFIRFGMQIQGPVKDGVVEAQGLLHISETRDLVNVLRTGPLPHALKIKKKLSRLVNDW